MVLAFVKTVHRLSVGQLTALLLCPILCGSSVAQIAQTAKPQLADKLIEAHRYEVAAKQEVETNCSLANARSLIDKAIQTGRTFRSASQLERDMMGAFLAEAEILRMRIVDKQKVAEQGASDAETLLKQRKVESARAAARQANLPSCEQRYRSLGDRIHQMDTRSAELLQQGDSIVRQRPLKAMQCYRKAKEINVEVARFDERMEAAKRIQKDLHVTTAGHKALVLILLVALLGGAGYAASIKQKGQGGS